MDRSGQLTGDLPRDREMLEGALGTQRSFDLVARPLVAGGRQGMLYFVDGFAKDDIMEKVMQALQSADPQRGMGQAGAEDFAAALVPYLETDQEGAVDALVTAVLSGTLCLLLEGYAQALLIDARTYPGRDVREPEDDHVLRGARDGFVETLVLNTALIRRRIRDPRLTMSITQIGQRSKTDVVMCYLEGTADPQLVERVRRKLAAVEVSALTMGQESLAECLLPHRWYDPFPKIRYSERPDAVAASVLEGSVVVLVDNCASVMLLPTSFFDFFQGTNDYYFPPLVGSYLKLVRLVIFALTLLLTPIWYLLVSAPESVPGWLRFVLIEEPNEVPILFQLLLIEFIIDGLKLASLNTPSVLSSSFSVVSALILGDFAVQAKWFVPEVVLFMAFVAIANFAQPSFELGWSFKLFRALLLLLVGAGQLWGLLLGLVLLVVLLARTHTVSGQSYLYPLVPFDGRALSRLLLRRRLDR